MRSENVSDISQNDPNFPGYSDYVDEMMDKARDQHIYDYIYTLQNFTTRETGTQGCEDAGIWIYNKFKEFGLDARMQNFSHNGNTVSNVIGYLNGTNPDKRDSTYIVSGHYDSTGGWFSDEAPGADDDASGTAVTLEAARILSDYSFNKSIRFCAWVAEEQGLVGSQHYVDNIDTSTQKVEGMYQFDMVGYADPGMNMTFHANTQSNWMLDYYNDTKKAYDIPLNLTFQYNSTEDRSDHSSFWDAGYNASMGIESEFSPYYHSADDTIDKVTIPMVTNNSKLAVSTLSHMAEPIKLKAEMNTPSSDELLIAEENTNITWDMNDPDGNPSDLKVDIYYSLDSDPTWNPIIENQTGFSSQACYQWNIPDISSQSAKLRIEIESESGLSVEEESAEFKIAKSTDYNFVEKGWQFISLSMIPNDTSIESILNDPDYGISGSYDKVIFYDSFSEEWCSYVPSRADHFNTLDNWNRSMGLWIHVTQPNTLTLIGFETSTTSILLKPGWNMVGYPSATNKLANDALPAEVSKIGVFNGSKKYNLNYIYELDTYTMKDGEGYWVFNDADYTVSWTVEY